MKHIHIIGIGGTFMGGIAAIAKEAGFKVSGCDAKMYPPMSTQLEALGIGVHEGFDAAQLEEFQADIYVIGNVARRGMDVVEAILNRGLPYISGPQWLAENVLHHHWVLGVAGTHGKTTTASMLAWVLEYAGLAPGFLIGGVPENFGVSARLPQTPRQDPNSKSPFFVIEADEYDTAFFDKRSKFVHYRPRTAVLNNLEFDHADILAVLEPRSNTMKLGTMKSALPASLKEADQVFCYAGGADWDVAEALAPLGCRLRVGKDFDTFVAEIVKNARTGDHILVMSNGGFGGIHTKLLDALR
ncbi:hypothetical protein GVH57_000492 [Neisseria gonorrhoeae]